MAIRSRTPARLPEAVEADAAAFFAHLSFACTPDAHVRAEAAEKMSANLPSFGAAVLLHGEPHVPPSSPVISYRQPQRVKARVEPDERPHREGEPRVAFYAGRERVAFAHDSEAPWLLPLLPRERGDAACLGFELAILAGGKVARCVRVSGIPQRLHYLGHV